MSAGSGRQPACGTEGEVSLGMALGCTIPRACATRIGTGRRHRGHCQDLFHHPVSAAAAAWVGRGREERGMRAAASVWDRGRAVQCVSSGRLCQARTDRCTATLGERPRGFFSSILKNIYHALERKTAGNDACAGSLAVAKQLQLTRNNAPRRAVMSTARLERAPLPCAETLQHE